MAFFALSIAFLFYVGWGSCVNYLQSWLGALVVPKFDVEFVGFAYREVVVDKSVAAKRPTEVAAYVSGCKKSCLARADG